MLETMLEKVSDNTKKQYEHVLKHLKEKQIRLTQTRKAIILYLVNSHDHPSAEMIYNDLCEQFDDMSLATVYNNLNFLVKEKIIIELKPAGNVSYYDFLDTNHHHVICKKCGTIDDFHFNDIAQLLQSAINQTGYNLHDSQIVIKGLCPKCQKLIETEN